MNTLQRGDLSWIIQSPNISRIRQNHKAVLYRQTFYKLIYTTLSHQLAQINGYTPACVYVNKIKNPEVMFGQVLVSIDVIPVLVSSEGTYEIYIGGGPSTYVYCVIYVIM